MNLNKRLLLGTLFLGAMAQAFGQMSILSGPEKGSYNHFANDIVTVLGQKNNLKLINRPTGGSAYNFNAITNPSSGDKIALIQADYLNLMIAKDKLNNTNLTGSLKVIMPLAKEEIHIIAKKKSGLSKLQDLEKKKVGVGDEDQGSAVTAKMIKDRSKIEWYTYNVGFDKMLKELANGNLDAGLFVGSAPIDLLDIDPQVMVDGISLFELTDFNDWAKFYENDTIYSGEYKWLEKNVPTFGLRTLLVVNEAKLTNDEKQTVAAIKSGIVQNLDYLRKQGHPKWKTVLIPDDAEVVPEKSATPVTAATSDNKDVVVYRVQLYSRNYQRSETVSISGQTSQTYVYSYKGAYRYTAGEFTSFSEAAGFQKKCREAGYPEAFVVAFKNNVRSTDPELFK